MSTAAASHSDAARQVLQYVKTAKREKHVAHAVYEHFVEAEGWSEREFLDALWQLLASGRVKYTVDRRLTSV